MIESSVVETIAERVERELERVRAARPALSSRVSRAANILVAHLSCRRQRLIRVRVGRDGRARFLVCGSGGAVYVVDPAAWSCSCPDHHRRGAACKHSIACWALWRSAAARPAPAAAVSTTPPPPAPALEPEEIPAELLEELDPAALQAQADYHDEKQQRRRDLRLSHGRSLRRDPVHDGDLPVVAPEVLDRMAVRLGVA